MIFKLIRTSEKPIDGNQTVLLVGELPEEDGDHVYQILVNNLEDLVRLSEEFGSSLVVSSRPPKLEIIDDYRE